MVKKDVQSESQLPEELCRLVYDAECWLCVSMKSKLEQIKMGQAGGNIRFVAYQSEEGVKALGHHFRPGRPGTAFLIKPSGEVRHGLEAFLSFVPSLPSRKFLLWALRVPFVMPLAEWVYRIIARYRYRWFGEATSVR
jgi:predicted DCC family thiol-disulfide oxidoreductase YuxK